MNPFCLTVIIFSFSCYAMEEDRKMSPDELREHNNNAYYDNRILLPDVYPMPYGLDAIILMRNNECHDRYLLLVSTVYDMCDFIFQNARNTALPMLAAINSGSNRFSGLLSMVIINRGSGMSTASLSTDDFRARRGLNNVFNDGFPSVLNIHEGFYSENLMEMVPDFVHESGHALRAQFGYMTQAVGPLVSFGGDFFRRIGWWQEELENTGIIPTANPWATENAFRVEAGLPYRFNYAGASADVYISARNLITSTLNLNNPGNYIFESNEFTIIFNIADF